MGSLTASGEALISYVTLPAPIPSYSTLWKEKGWTYPWMDNNWSCSTAMTYKCPLGHFRAFLNPLLLYIICFYFCIIILYYIFMYIKMLYFVFPRIDRPFVGIYLAYFSSYIHETKTLLFTCRYQRFLDSRALSLINKTSEYPSHSWSQMLPTFLYHSWVS